MGNTTSPEDSNDADPPQNSSVLPSTSPTNDTMYDPQSRTSQIPLRTPQPNPVRSMTTINSTSAIQRALSSQRHTVSLNGILEGTRDRSTKSDANPPTWPTSPRLKSPPPSTSRTSGSKKEGVDNVQPNTAKRLATVSAPELAAAMLLPEHNKEQSQSQTSSQLRVPTRGVSAPNTGLETVVEGSLPTTPSIDPKSDPIQNLDLDLDSKSETSTIANLSTKESETKAEQPPPRNTVSKPDNEPPKSRAPIVSKQSGNLAKRSFTNLTGNKKAAAEPIRTMTVETEPVSAITSGLGERARDSGSVRTKTSTETIRPKKEKKKPVRKAASLHAGGVTSKADIFEAKVASAVDEADTSDSDETFVYESNPPEPRGPYRHHSRTPSATSLASTHDHYRGGKMRSGSNAIPGKKSMKFSNSIHTRENEDDPNRGSIRTTSSTPRHHHIGRHGRNNPSVLTDDSLFNQGRHPHSPRNPTSLKSPRPSSPRSGARITSPRKYGGHAYDNNEDAADDERMPLIGTVRVKPSRHSRRPHSREFRDLEYGDEEAPRCWTRCGAFSLLVFLFVLICAGTAAFVVAVNQPLLDVEIRHIQNVLASEQELMLDLDVKAVNPNLFAITVTDLDISVFAESPYVGTTSDWNREHPNPNPNLRLSFNDRRLHPRSWFWNNPPPHMGGGVDEGTDPDDPAGLQKMLLGRVYELDSPLTFDPAPIRRNPSSSVGEISLSKPGNKTEIGGSERWEKVLAHDFDLIVRGVLQYQLPFSSKWRTVKIGARKTIYPSEESSTE